MAVKDTRAGERSGSSRWSWLLGSLGGLLLLAFTVYAVGTDEMDVPWMAMGGVGAALVLAWLVLEKEDLQRAAENRGIRHSVAGTALVAMALAVAVVVNILAVRYDKRVDMTSSKRYTLSDQSRAVLSGLQDEIEVLAFFPTGSPEGEDFMVLAGNAEAASDKLSVRMLDPVREPMEAQQHGITSSWGTVVLRKGEETRKLESSFGEESLVNALVQLVAGKKHTVCFTTGHQELDIEDSYSPAGMGLAIEKMQGQNYSAEALSLVKEGGVPEDCAILVIGGPQYDLLAAEQEMVAAHVAGGGDVLILLDPAFANAFALDLERYGMLVGDDIILEQNPKYQMAGADASYILLDGESFAPHPLIQLSNAMVLLQGVRSVRAVPEKEGLQIQELAKTTANSWAERGYREGIPEPDIGEDDIGSIPLLVVAEVTDPEKIYVGSTALEGQGAENDSAPAVERKAGAKVLVVGSSSIASNAAFSLSQANVDLFLNAIAWMAGEEAQISSRASDDAVASLAMNMLQGLMSIMLCLVIAPGAMLIGAISTWRNRRSR